MVHTEGAQGCLLNEHMINVFYWICHRKGGNLQIDSCFDELDVHQLLYNQNFKI